LLFVFLVLVFFTQIFTCTYRAGLPYDSSSTEVLLKSIEKKAINFPSYVSLEAQELIKKMLHITPSKRATLQQIKDHKWLASEIKSINSSATASSEQNSSSLNLTQNQINDAVDSKVEQNEQNNPQNIAQRKLMYDLFICPITMTSYSNKLFCCY